MAIGHLGDIDSDEFQKPSGFFSELEKGTPTGATGTLSSIESGDSIVSDECTTENYSSGQFTNASGDCYADSYSEGRFEGGDGEEVTTEPYQSYSSGPFTIYGSPTHETPFNLYKDFYTYDKLNQEYMERASSRIIVAKLDREQTDVDAIIGEPTGNEIFKKGVVVYGVYELNPIIQELSKFGISEDEDIILKFNYTHCIERIGRPVAVGDIIAVYLTSARMTEAQLAADQLGKDFYVRQIRKLYRVNTSIPKSMFLYNYLEIECNCTKTNMDLEIVYDWNDCYEINEVPDDINSADPNPVPIQV